MRETPPGQGAFSSILPNAAKPKRLDLIGGKRRLRPYSNCVLVAKLTGRACRRLRHSANGLSDFGSGASSGPRATPYGQSAGQTAM
jgi:hypothetical protein